MCDVNVMQIVEQEYEYVVENFNLADGKQRYQAYKYLRKKYGWEIFTDVFNEIVKRWEQEQREDYDEDDAKQAIRDMLTRTREPEEILPSTFKLIKTLKEVEERCARSK